METNVFDYIEEFYEQDPEWNGVIPKEVCERFLRRYGWNGGTQVGQTVLWNHILSFMLYCGYADVLPGDMTVDDILLCVGWCIRNVAEFEPTEKYIIDFLDTMTEFLAYMKSGRFITKNGFTEDAKKRLMPAGQGLLVRKDGTFTGKLSRLNNQGICDLPAKVFISSMDQIAAVINLLESDDIKKWYPDDYRRARTIYTNIGENGLAADMASHDEYQAFIDYFCFDYKLLRTGRPVIEDIARQIEADLSGKYSYPFKVAISEVAKAKLVLFVIKKDLGNGIFSVLDIIRNESHVLALPLDDYDACKEMLFCAHTFSDCTMVVNFMRGAVFPEEYLTLLKKILRKLKNFYSVRCGGKCSWDEFVANNQLIIRMLPAIIGNKIPLNESWPEIPLGYKPAVLDKDDFLRPVLREILSEKTFAKVDFDSAMQIWADVQSIDLPEDADREEDPTLLALAVAKIYISLCGVYGFKDPEAQDEEMREVQRYVGSLVDEISGLLKIEKFDSRYVSEEGRFLMLVGQKETKKNGR